MINKYGWYWFLSGQENKLNMHKCGKRMYFFNDQEYAIKICELAIKEGACYECKCTNLNKQMTDTGVICFYLNGDDIENHYRVIDFMIKYDLIRKTKSGKYYNNSFKFDDQTRAGEYGADFEGKIKLNEYIDLETGKHIKEIHHE